MSTNYKFPPNYTRMVKNRERKEKNKYISDSMPRFKLK